MTAPSWLPTPAAATGADRVSTNTNAAATTTPALRRRDVVVVYVGQAENIRKRLQEFGQPGAHLERSRYFTTQKIYMYPPLHKLMVQELRFHFVAYHILVSVYIHYTTRIAL